MGDTRRWLSSIAILRLCYSTLALMPDRLHSHVIFLTISIVKWTLSTVIPLADSLSFGEAIPDDAFSMKMHITINNHRHERTHQTKWNYARHSNQQWLMNMSNMAPWLVSEIHVYKERSGKQLEREEMICEKLSTMSILSTSASLDAPSVPFTASGRYRTLRHCRQGWLTKWDINVYKMTLSTMIDQLLSPWSVKWSAFVSGPLLQGGCVRQESGWRIELIT